MSLTDPRHAGFAPISNLSGLRLIVVDDNGDNADLFAEFLRACGATVRVAWSGEEALRCLDAEPPFDLMLTDLAMPGLNGIELLSRMRARHATLPAIAVSGFPEKNFVGDAAQFSAFLLKPVELELLAATIERVVTPAPQ
jgi:CheY-like chemotaxis protein